MEKGKRRSECESGRERERKSERKRKEEKREEGEGRERFFVLFDIDQGFAFFSLHISFT